MSVKRYGLHIASQYPISGGVYIDKRVEVNGDYVLHIDYAALLARVARLEEFRKEFIDAWDSGMGGDSYLYRMAKALEEK